MRKLNLKNIFLNKKALIPFFIDFLFYFHISVGFFILTFFTYKFNFKPEESSFIWLLIFFPIFIAKIRKDYISKKR